MAQKKSTNSWPYRRIFWVFAGFYVAVFFGSGLYFMFATKLPGRLLINTTACIIIHVHPFERPEVEILESSRKVRHCTTDKSPLIVDANYTSIFVTQSARDSHNGSNISCYYQSFQRIEPQGSQTDFQIVFSRRKYHFNESTPVHDSLEFVQVVCKIRTGNQTAREFTDYFAFVPKRHQKPKPPEGALNVLIVGVDASSRLHAHRELPKTLKFLKNISAIELLGYNRVADNTFPNLVPLITGLTDNELAKVCWKKNVHERFDNCPTIFEDFQRLNYFIALGEDAANLGLFHFEKKGFFKNKFDYYYDYFNRVAEEYGGHLYKNSVLHCIGPREDYKLLLNYIDRFLHRMHQDQAKFFSFFWETTLNHDWPELHIADDDYLKLFRKLQTNNQLNNTVVVFMSDHGMRGGSPWAGTIQGEWEKNLPFSFLLFPEWFKNQHPEEFKNLADNTQKLTTHFDVYATFKDIMFYSGLTNNKPQHPGDTARGISLFRSISEKRSCKHIGIQSKYCACGKSL